MTSRMLHCEMTNLQHVALKLQSVCQVKEPRSFNLLWPKIAILYVDY